MSKSQPHLSVGFPEQWRQISFIFFDLGVMNVIGGAGAAFFYSLPLLALGFRYSSFWLGGFFILIGLSSLKARRLPIAVPIVIIAVDLWNTIRLLPQYEQASGVVLVQISFVLPLVLMLSSMLRVRLKFVSPRPEGNPLNVTIGTGKEALALLSSMFASVGVGLAALLLFANYVLGAITESTNPLINIFHDLFLVPALLVLFPLGAAAGELIWLRAIRFYLIGNEISLFIRYLKQLPLISKLLERMLKQDSAQSSMNPNQMSLTETPISYQAPPLNPRVFRKQLLAASVTLISLASVLIFIRAFIVPEVLGGAATNEESVPAAGTLVVSQSGRGQYRSINAAVADAPPGATILVRAGVYRENVLIDKDITLTGDQRDSDRATIECAKDDCVRITALKADVRNLSIHAKLGFLARLFSSQAATGVLVLNGRSVIEACDVSSNSGAGIVVSGSASAPEIRNVRVHDCRLNGILFTNRSQGLVANSDIYENKWAGIRSENQSHPTVLHSRIHHGRMDGILVDMQGAASFEECEIFENNYSGVHVRGASFVSLSHCKIFKQTGGGIFIHDRSFGKADACDVSENENAGIEVADESDAQVLETKVHNQQTAGIIIWRNSSAAVEGATIYENGSMGLLVASGSKPIIRKSVFRSHTYSAIEVKNGGDPLIENSQIYGGRTSGIYFYEGGMGRVHDCSVFGNMASNIVIASGSNPQIRKSSLSESGYAGVLVLDGGQGLINDCQIFNNYLGIEIKENSTPAVRDCAIKNNRHQGLVADRTSAGSITGSELVGNWEGAWKIEDGSRLLRNGNTE